MHSILVGTCLLGVKLSRIDQPRLSFNRWSWFAVVALGAVDWAVWRTKMLLPKRRNLRNRRSNSIAKIVPPNILFSHSKLPWLRLWLLRLHCLHRHQPHWWTTTTVALAPRLRLRLRQRKRELVWTRWIYPVVWRRCVTLQRSLKWLTTINHES